MGQTISEKVIAKYAGKRTVTPGDYVVVKDFLGPIGYSFKGMNFPQAMGGTMQMLGLSIAKPENMIINGDHNTPAQSPEDVELFNSVRTTAAQMGISRVYDKEGIGHIVNIEKGDITSGSLFVHIDPQAANAGGIGAYYTNGGRFGSSMMEAFALGELTIRVPESIKIEINGELPSFVTGRDIWLSVLNEIGPDCAFGMILEFSGSTIDKMAVEERMILCGNAGFAGADGAILQADEVTQAWFKENFNQEIETIKSDADAVYAKTFKFDASKFVPMVTVPPEVFTSKPASELNEVKLNQCIIGTCVGGTLLDLRIAAKILAGKKVHHDVRLLISPASQRIYIQASKEGLLATLAEAGAKILSPTCDVCLGVQGPLAAGEVGLSQQTLNVPGRSGSVDADIYLASAATIAASAITGFITDPTKTLGGVTL